MFASRFLIDFGFYYTWVFLIMNKYDLRLCSYTVIVIFDIRAHHIIHFIYLLCSIGFGFGLGSILVFRFMIYIIINIYIQYSINEICR